jgi:glycosyltransferase involved in cell wall biosynthesis
VKYLFIHQNFPGQFYYLLQHLQAQKKHDLVFISEPNANVMNGVRRIPYVLPRGAHAETHFAAQEFDIAMMRADLVAQKAAQLKQLGFVPDVIIGHHGWGELLNLNDVYRDTPVIGYFEFYYDVYGGDANFDPEYPLEELFYPRVRARNNVNLLALTNPGYGQTPTRFQLNTYPDWAQRKITVVPEGAHLDICKPDPAARRKMFHLGDFSVSPKEKLVTFVSRNLEPYRGFHSMMRALVHLQKARPDVKAILVGGDEVSYGAMPKTGGTWREVMLREVGDQLDLSRILFPGKIEYDRYIAMLQRSDAHVYLSYPFVASWSLRESLACGCVVIGSDTASVREFVVDHSNGLLAPMLEPRKLADIVLAALEDTRLAKRLRGNARAWAEEHLQMATHITEFEKLIQKAIQRK